ncbi:MAG TPA: purine-nucleoside phosphorylase [Bacteroidales bacterium]|nr:purine-nucleoside phosphorylase [Bacteroidales bacterium]
MLEKIKSTASFIRDKIDITPEIGIILGTGLGGVVKDMDIQHQLEYEKIPNFPVSTVDGHHGKLIFGELGGKKIVAMQGRFHYYEGYDMQEVTFPVRVMKLLGIKTLIVSNASGGVNPDFEVGDIMIMNDHINLLPNPLIGKNLDALGNRIVDMSEPYDPEMIRKAEEIATENNIRIQKGCYVATTGPTLETPKEYQYFRIIGGDAVGMSTVPEVIVARHMDIPCFAVSVITDLGVPGKIEKISHEDVQRAAEKVKPKLTFLMEQFVASL